MLLALTALAQAEPLLEARVTKANGKTVAAARNLESDWRDGVPWVFSVRGDPYALVADGDTFCVYRSLPGVQGVPTIALSCVSGPGSEVALPGSDKLSWSLHAVDAGDATAAR